MKDKKTEQVAFRVSPEEKELLEKAAGEMNLKLGALAGALVTQFVKFRGKHGNRLIWPPEFNYYPASTHSMQEAENLKADVANGSSKKKAG